MTNFYQERQTAKVERMESRADQMAAEGIERAERSRSFFRDLQGQPVHGRTDANRRRKLADNWDRGLQMQIDANKLQDRAKRVGSGGVASDDPDAVAKLERKLAYLQEQHAELKAFGAAYRKHRNAVVKSRWGLKAKEGRAKIETAEWRLAQMTDDEQADIREAQTEVARRLVEDGAEPKNAVEWAAGNFGNQFGVPSYELTNLNARIKSTQKRIEELVTVVLEDDDFHAVGTFSDGTEWEATLEEGRYRIRSAKPDRSVTSLLRQLGFKWSRYETAWQLKVTPAQQDQIESKLDRLGREAVDQ